MPLWMEWIYSGDGVDIHKSDQQAGVDHGVGDWSQDIDKGESQGDRVLVL